MSKSRHKMLHTPNATDRDQSPEAASVTGSLTHIIIAGMMALCIAALAMAFWLVLPMRHFTLLLLITFVAIMLLLGGGLFLASRAVAGRLPPSVSSETLGKGDNPSAYSREEVANQSRVLDILYDAAASVTVLQDLDKLLDKYLITLMDLSGAKAGLVRLREDDDQMRLISHRGLTAEFARQQRHMPADYCLSGTEITGGLLLRTELVQAELVLALGSEQVEKYNALAIPIVYHELRLGVYNLVIEKHTLEDQPELCNLFAKIGRHLGLAIEKARIENHARRLSIMEERTLLANELHDSLAQSLASLRFQVGMVQETIEQSRDRTGLNQIRMIKDGLDQANSQLRELLVHFRTRMDERGLVPAIELMIDRFQKQTGVSVFFQDELGRSDLSPAMEVQVLHIVQEALTNVRKHAGAQYVRVLLRSDHAGHFSVLVEDDGQGIVENAIKSVPGENIGITIMKERASRIGGMLLIESEPGEGTRVELNFNVNSAAPSTPLRITS